MNMYIYPDMSLFEKLLYPCHPMIYT